MLLKIEYKYDIDKTDKYSLMDGIERIDEGITDTLPVRNYIKVYKKNRKNDSDHELLYCDDVIFYVMNDEGKTLQIIRPYKA